MAKNSQDFHKIIHHEQSTARSDFTLQFSWNFWKISRKALNPALSSIWLVPFTGLGGLPQTDGNKVVAFGEIEKMLDQPASSLNDGPPPTPCAHIRHQKPPPPLLVDSIRPVDQDVQGRWSGGDGVWRKSPMNEMTRWFDEMVNDRHRLTSTIHEVCISTL